MTAEERTQWARDTAREHGSQSEQMRLVMAAIKLANEKAAIAS